MSEIRDRGARWLRIVLGSDDQRILCVFSPDGSSHAVFLPWQEAEVYEPKRPSNGWACLTPTERAVADLVAAGLTNAQIAAELFITVATVKTHVHHVFTELGLTNRTQLAAAALRGRVTPVEARVRTDLPSGTAPLVGRSARQWPGTR